MHCIRGQGVATRRYAGISTVRGSKLQSNRLPHEAREPPKQWAARLQSILRRLSYGPGLKKSANGFGLGTPTPVTSSQPGAVFR
jgi:hypothetical protein